MSPNIYFSPPSTSLFNFPAAADPTTLAAPPAPYSPFNLPAELYQQAYDARVPLTIAATYAVTAITMNKVNAARGNKPWAISKTRWFHWLVVLHNTFLAVYSAWTFVGMWKGLSATIPRPSGPDGIIGVVDSLCKLHGPAGLSNSVAYSPAQNTWVSSATGQDDVTAAALTAGGRLWNECLAFYGWFFYLSKFYEVIDTVIILAKGKKSSTLQTYHHAGAMMCMWAGMRYMTPAIWLFCFLNSGVHAMMYTYYTITAFRIRVPKAVKQTLTTMQIMQFVIGVYYAAAHSFISYDIPVTSTYANASETQNTTVPAIVKSIIYRAAGAEGLAEAVGKAGAEVHQTIGYKTVDCLDTQGQTFATWLNVFYLGPLMYLFMRFFYRSYIRRSSPAKGKSTVKAVEGAVVDAAKGTDRALNGSTRSRKA